MDKIVGAESNCKDACGTVSMGQAMNMAVQKKEQTVEELLTLRIQRAREEVERLCLLKAKAETSQLLQYPARFLGELGG